MPIRWPLLPTARTLIGPAGGRNYLSYPVRVISLVTIADPI